MIETIIAAGIVASVLVLAGRSFYRTITGKNNGCSSGCAGCSCREAGKPPYGSGDEK